MKKRVIKKQLSCNERKRLMKEAKELRAIQNQMHIILMAVSSVMILQGKLGFTKGQRDADFSVSAQAIYDALTLNTGSYYTPPFAQMAAFLNAITDYNTAIKNCEINVLGCIGAKKEAKTALYGILKNALSYVNNLAWNLQSAAEEIITGAKMHMKQTRVKDKPDFAVRQGSGTGTVVLDCIAVRVNAKYVKATYNWQYSEDNGVTWIAFPDTQAAKMNAEDIVVNVPLKFRKRSNSQKTGTSEWCTPIVFTVK